MSAPVEYLSMAYFDLLRERLRKVLGEEAASVVNELIFAVRHEHEKNEHRDR